MKRKWLCFALATAIVCVLLSSCSSGEAYDKHTELQPDENGMVTILTEGITNTVRYFNYDANGVVVQLVALRDRNGGVHIAFNTCQSCSPSPKAYYQQSGDVLQCTNCGFTFEPEQVGITAGGCNPWPIDGVSIANEKITVPISSLDAMRSTFASWAGPTK